MLALLAAAPASAGPVSYQGGYMLSTENAADSVSWQLSYSPRAWFSLGADYSYDRGRSYGLARANWLAHRWNELDSQANLYLYGAGGLVQADDRVGAAWMYGAEADWESRAYLVSARAQALDSARYEGQRMFQARFGIAPYQTSFDKLHAWVIFQAQYWPDESRERLRIGPVMRFYVENILWEAGVSARGTWWLNAMIHF